MLQVLPQDASAPQPHSAMIVQTGNVIQEATSEVPVVGSPVLEYEVEEEEEEEDEEEARMRKKKRSLAVALPPADKGILMRPSYRYSPSCVTADDDDATPTPSLSHPPSTPALTKPPPVTLTTTTTTTSDVTPHPTPPQTTGKVTGKACEVRHSFSNLCRQWCNAMPTTLIHFAVYMYKMSTG
ncbi:uncharacterized protein LOC135098261 [Scylla paramamosain]|uniref:uncharacterized protein LOC135098261 n=1 Tax=Scylla paramamosain TaxID=85552 RepID=UPI003082C5C9